MPAPKLRMYSIEAIVAKNYQALVDLGVGRGVGVMEC